MRKKHDHRHFLSYTFEHLLGAFVVLLVACALGALAKTLAAPTLIASTATNTLTQSSETTPLPAVYFGATRLEAGCIEGVTKAKYHFTIDPQEGGYLSLSGSMGSDYVDYSNGRGFDRILPVGAYTWSGFPRPGYVGNNSGTFAIEELCTTSTSGTAGGSTSSGTSNTSSGTSATTTTTTDTIPTPPPPEISFSVQVAALPNCTTGTPITPVYFLATKSQGGSFTLSSDTGVTNMYFGLGEYPLPNGNYIWSAQVGPGYVGVGALSGTFALHHTCTTVATTTSTIAPAPAVPTPIATSTTSTFPITPSSFAATPPQIRLFVDNTPVVDANATFDDEEIELRITTPRGSAVSIGAVDGKGMIQVLGNAVQDDLLSTETTDIWSYIMNAAKFPEGTMRLVARMRYADGREAVTPDVYLVLKRSVVNAPSGVRTISSTSVRPTTEDHEALLERIADPASCGNQEECRIFCASVTGRTDSCATFTQTQIKFVFPRGLSLADEVSDARLEQLLEDPNKRPKNIPDAIQYPQEFRQFCGDMAHAEVCTKILVRNDMSRAEELRAKQELITHARSEVRQIFTDRTGARQFLDSDNDGVTDYDEVNIYDTDPSDGDTDHDGFQDGAEILARTNPSGDRRVVPTSGSTTPMGTLGNRSGESTLFENPMIAGVTEPELLAVNNVSVSELGTSASGSTTIKKLALSGVAIPNSFVTLYIFSDPIIVTVKADATGAWTYTLEKELPDGTHQVYTAMTDAGGRILAKSDPLPFVKVAAAVSVGTSGLLPGVEEPGFFTGTSLYALIAILIGVLGLAVSLIGFIVHQKEVGEGMRFPGS